MSAENKDIKEIFQQWNELNDEVGEAFSGFDLAETRKIREKQRKLEDKIYEILLEKAPDDLKQHLPENPGEMEFGYETEAKKFYFLMYSPDEEEDNIWAFIMDSEGNVEIDKDFKHEEE